MWASNIDVKTNKSNVDVIFLPNEVVVIFKKITLQNKFWNTKL